MVNVLSLFSWPLRLGGKLMFGGGFSGQPGMAIWGQFTVAQKVEDSSKCTLVMSNKEPHLYFIFLAHIGCLSQVSVWRGQEGVVQLCHWRLSDTLDGPEFCRTSIFTNPGFYNCIPGNLTYQIFFFFSRFMQKLVEYHSGCGCRLWTRLSRRLFYEIISSMCYK